MESSAVTRPKQYLNETRLSRWHPYPAMVPDELATKIARDSVRPKMRILDPFCGSGRFLLAAANEGAECIGYDVNPLAILITEAKSAAADIDTIKRLRDEAIKASKSKFLSDPVFLRTAVRVQWFSDQVSEELGQIIFWLNSLKLSHSEKLIVAVSLSAATRDAAWIRKSGWKLHRQSKEVREHSSPSAWDRFIFRLDHYISQSQSVSLSGSVKMKMADFKQDNNSDVYQNESLFDYILTSPPYGDSNTTVQYGAASGLCLDVVTRIEGLEHLFVPGSLIDRTCLGGRKASDFECSSSLRRYWAGGKDSPYQARVATFLDDYARSCEAISNVLKPGGKIVFVVGRRTVGGYRVKLDDFTTDQFETHGIKLHSVSKRTLRNKRLPSHINRFASAASSDQQVKGKTKTMSEEIVLTFASSKRQSSN